MGLSSYPRLRKPFYLPPCHRQCYIGHPGCSLGSQHPILPYLLCIQSSGSDTFQPMDFELKKKQEDEEGGRSEQAAFDKVELSGA